MKFAVVLLVLLPLAYSASFSEKRFIEQLLGGYDILELAKQVLARFGNDETEAQCEHTYCPQLVDPIDGHNTLITTLVCTAVCSEAQILAGHYLSTPSPTVVSST